MPIVLSSGGQTRTRNCYAPSAQARLSLRTNGEEEGVVISGTSVVFAGFDAPTVTPTVATAGAGNVVPGYYVYRYVYASSRYPFVANAITGDGQEWPRSSPSPPSATYFVDPAAESNAVTVTYTTRSDVDWIWLYRTSVQTTAALAEAQDAAGQLFFVASALNSTAGGTRTITDNVAAGNGNEPLELDNFTCPLFRYSVFDGFFWWGWGNKTLQVIVLLDDTATITIDATSPEQAWFSGRDSDPINGAPTSISFYGITTGGYDGRGNYYFRRVTATTAHIYDAPAMSSAVILLATGTTTAYLTSPTTTLYRSKYLNPFSWGITTEVFSGAGSAKIPVASLFAEQVGGGVGTAISLIPNERILKLDTEAPERSYALDLNAAESSDFIGTLRTLDDAQSVGSFFSQFPMRLSDGQSVGTGINAKALQILSADAQSQIPIGSNVIATLRNIVRESDAPTFYHGVYDRDAELNCWFFRTTEGPWRCDTLVYQHAPTGTWGKKYVPGVSASWTVFDNITEKFHTFVGNEAGLIGIAFYADRFADWVFRAPTNSNPAITGTQFITEVLATIVSASVTAGVMTVTVQDDPHPFSAGDVILISFNAGPTAGDGRYTVITAPTGLTFTVASPLPDGTTFTDGAVTDDFASVPFVIGNVGVDSLYVATYTGGIVLNSLLEGIGFYTWGNVQTDLVAINLNTDALKEGLVFPGDTTSYQIYPGNIPAFFARYFNAQTPEKSKKLIEAWFTIQNVDVFLLQYVKFLKEYQSRQLSGTLTGYLINLGLNSRDKIGSTSENSDVYFTKNPAETLMHSCGMELLEIGYLAWTIHDFTLKQKPA